MPALLAGVLFAFVLGANAALPAVSAASPAATVHALDDTGSIVGTVTALATGAWIPNVPISVYEAEASTTPGAYTKGPLMATTLTAVDGSYSVAGLTAGSYFVDADGTGAGFGFGEQVVAVVAGTSVRADFALGPPPGTLAATVTRSDTLAAVSGALVEALQGGTVVASGYTDSGGLAMLSVNAGSYSVVASKPGFGVSPTVTAVITSLNTTPVALSLTPTGTGSLSGQVVSAASGLPIGGITMHVSFNGVDQVATVLTASTFTDPGTGQPVYNFIFPSVPAGIVTVSPSAPGWTIAPASRSITVVSGQQTTGVDFSLTGLYAFQAKLQLISTPYDYEFSFNGVKDVNDPATLLNIAPGSLQLATFIPQENRYQFYPQAPADHFRLGRGYWMNLPNTTDLVSVGALATDPYDIPLQQGWNLVGDPFGETIDFTTVTLTDASGTYTYSEATNVASPKLGAVLYAYVLGGYQTTQVLSPWAGYWLYTAEAMTLHVSQAAGGLAVNSAAAQKRGGVPVPQGGWVMPLEVSAGGCVDAATYLGEGKQAGTQYKAGLDLVKPPAADFQPYVYAGFSKAGAPGPLALDVRALGANQTWTLTVTTNQKGARVTVGWPDLSSVPNNLRPMLTDSATGTKVYMRTTGSYQFVAQATTRVFTITLAASTTAPAVISALNAQSVSGGATVVYTLAADAAATVEIRNLSGILIRRLISQVPQSAGVQTLSWNGRNETGAVVPAGRYLIAVTAATPDGCSASALATVWLQR
jgi:hypothetical protein